MTTYALPTTTGLHGQTHLLNPPTYGPHRYHVMQLVRDNMTGVDSQLPVGQSDAEHDAHKIAHAAILDAIGRQLNAGHTRDSAKLPRMAVYEAHYHWSSGYATWISHALWYGAYNASIGLVVDGALRDALDAVHDADYDWDDAVQRYVSGCPITRYLRAIWNDRDNPDDTAIDGGHIGQCLQWDSVNLKLSWYPVSRPVTIESPYAASSRHSAKLVRAIKTLYPAIQATDAQWAAFNDRMIARLNPATSIDIVSGPDIAETYDMQHHEHIGSCMAGNGHYMALYASNPNQIQLVRVTADTNDLLLGRALLWKQDDGTHYLDRIYASDPRVEQQIRDYVTEHVPHLTHYAGHVTIPNYDHDVYPYLDTFSYLDMESGSLTSHYPGGWYRTLRSTDGDYDETGRSQRVTVTFTVDDPTIDDLEYELRRWLERNHNAYNIDVETESAD